MMLGNVMGDRIKCSDMLKQLSTVLTVRRFTSPYSLKYDELQYKF